MLMKWGSRRVSSSFPLPFLFPFLLALLSLTPFSLFLSLFFPFPFTFTLSFSLPFTLSFALSFPFPFAFSLSFTLSFFLLLSLPLFGQLMVGYRRTTVMRGCW